MKKQLLNISILFVLITSATTALALTGKDSWKSIRSSREVLIQQPAFAEVFGPQGLFNACATHDEFRSRTPVKTCLNANCSEFENRHIVISRIHNKEVCTRFAEMSSDSSGECLEYAVVTAIHPTGFQLPIIEASGVESGDYIFSKKYSVPSCE